MEMRTTCPSGYNKYYMTSDCGGYSWAIKGYPNKADANVLANCVGYANSRFAEIIGKDCIEYQLVCNAENFIEKAQSYGLKVVSYPVLGGIMVWQKGSLSSGDGAGHVAIVERIDSSNQIYTSESGYGGSAFWNSIRTNDNGRWGQGSAYSFRGCIVNPAIGDTPMPTDKIVVDGLWGKETTRKAQQVFGTPVDGIVSNQLSWWKNNNLGLLSSTFEWQDSMNGGSALIRAIQRKVGANVDGYIGSDTISKMQQWLGTPVDGCVSNPSAMVSAFQTWLNQQ